MIDKARRWRKLLGGGMRQVGILAAAGIMALTQHVERLADDHANAALLLRELSALDGIDIHPWSGQTNMVFLSLPNHSHAAFADWLAARQIRVTPLAPIRLVTHLDITADDVQTFVAAVREFLAQ